MRVKYTVLLTPTQTRKIVRNHLALPAFRGAYKVAEDWQRSIPHVWPGQKGFITGNTARSITVRRVSQTDVAVGSASVSARSLEEGAIEHEIRPRGMSLGSWYSHTTKGGQLAVLRWPEERGGRTMPHDPPGWRVRWVAHHPGVKARGYGWRAMQNQQNAILHDLQRALERIP